ncbi:hypothetical protein EBQ93_01930 [bacterium]|nr:hypothetical protein [bacterium]
MVHFLYIFYLLFASSYLLGTENIIGLFLQKYPTVVDTDDDFDEKISKPLMQPNYTNNPNQQPQDDNQNTGVPGVVAIHQGYVSTSDYNGTLVFPRHQPNNSVIVAITPQITPIYMIGPSTVHHWEFIPEQPKAAYLCTFLEDEETHAYIWKVEKMDIPENNLIRNMPTIVLLTHPDLVYVPEGITMSVYSPNLLVPPVYIKQDSTLATDALYMPNRKMYFETIQKQYKQYHTTLSHIVITE